MTPAPALIIEGTEHPFSFLLQPQATSDVGRGSKAMFRIPLPTVGRRQARFSAHDGAWWVEDLGSPSGTWLDDKMVRGKARIEVGSRLRLGGFRALVTASGQCLVHTKTPWPLERVLALADGLAEGLARHHAEGRLHCDILPGWILLEEPTGRARLAGWLDRSVEEVLQSRKPHYVAPELYRLEQATPAADIFAVGCILREWLTGHYPFNSDTILEMLGAVVKGNVQALPPNVPEPVARLLDAMVQPDPRRRPADGAALQAELRLAR
jgi:hypothetical protein